MGLSWQARHYLQRLGGLSRARRLITISTPHHGTRIARFLDGQGCVQMRPESHFLKDLNSDVRTLDQVDPVSIWTPLDLTIQPATSSILPVGRDLKVRVIQHTLMLWSRTVIDAVVEAIEETRRSRESRCSRNLET